MDSTSAQSASGAASAPLIWVVMKGGLGNQLFQWAAARALAMDWGTGEPAIDMRLYRRSPWRRAFLAVRHRWRELTLGVDRAFFFRMQDRVAELEKIGIVLPSLPPGGPTIAQSRLAWRDPALERMLGRRIVRSIKDIDRSRPEPILLAGWLQDESLFAHRATDLRAALRDTHDSPALRRWADVLAADDAVAVHVRRGDYLKPANRRFAIQSPAYFEQAAQLVRERTGAASFYLFTDDPGWVRTHLKLPGRSSIVSGEAGMTASDDFSLMRRARHFVIGNSTFSWWAAWLAERSGTCVVAPSTWMYGMPPPTAMLPQRWTVLDVPPLPPVHPLS